MATDRLQHIAAMPPPAGRAAVPRMRRGAFHNRSGQPQPRLAWKVAAHSAAHGVGGVVQFALVAALARLLDLEHFASYVAAAAVVGVCEMTSDFGTRIWAMRQFSLPGHCAADWRRAWVVKACYTLVTAAVVLLAPLPGLGWLARLLCVAIAATQPASDPLLWYVRGRERLDLEAGALVLWRLVNAAALVALAAIGVPLEWLLAGWLSGNVVRLAAEACLPVVRDVLTNCFRTPVSVLEGLRLAPVVFPIGAALALMALFYRLPVLGLGYVGQVADVAAFGAAFTVASSLGFVGTSITLAWFPRLARTIAGAAAQSPAETLRASLWQITCVMAPVCVGAMAISPTALPWLLGAKVPSSGWLLVALMPALYLSSINAGLKIALNALGRNWPAAAAAGVGIGVAVATLAVSVPWPPTYLAAFAWTLGELAIFAIQAILVGRSALRGGLAPGIILATFAALIAAAAGRLLLAGSHGAGLLM